MIRKIGFLVIGHSLGTLFGLNLVEKNKVKCFVSVAGFGGLPGNKFDSGMTTFAQKFDWERIRANTKYALVFHGDNDPYVKMETASELAKNLNTEAIIITNGGHLESSDGYSEFPLLLSKVLDLC